jgi:DNA topoisomerase-1
MRDVKREERPTNLVCEKCGKPMVIKWGRRGEFLACSGYPECKTTMNFTRDDDGTIRPAQPETTDEVCEKCGRPMQVRFGRYGKFLGCSGYPDCKNMQPLHKPVPTGVKCLGCGQGELMERRSRRGKLFYSCNRYPDCQFVAWDRPIPEPCPRCAAPFITEKVTKRYGTIRRCVREECGWQTQIAGDDEEVAPLPERRAAAKLRPRRTAPAAKASTTKAKAPAPDTPRRPAARGRATSR